VIAAASVTHRAGAQQQHRKSSPAPGGFGIASSQTACVGVASAHTTRKSALQYLTKERNR
jgi:hypothetical protein